VCVCGVATPVRVYNGVFLAGCGFVSVDVCGYACVCVREFVDVCVCLRLGLCGCVWVSLHACLGVFAGMCGGVEGLAGVCMWVQARTAEEHERCCVPEARRLMCDRAGRRGVVVVVLATTYYYALLLTIPYHPCYHLLLRTTTDYY